MVHAGFQKQEGSADYDSQRLDRPGDESISNHNRLQGLSRQLSFFFTRGAKITYCLHRRHHDQRAQKHLKPCQLFLPHDGTETIHVHKEPNSTRFNTERNKSICTFKLQMQSRQVHTLSRGKRKNQTRRLSNDTSFIKHSD
jgi:hypothetical protein